MKMLSQLQIYLPALKAAGLIWHITRLQYRLHIAITYCMAPFRIGQVTQQGTGNSKFNININQIVANFEDQALVDAGVYIKYIFSDTYTRITDMCGMNTIVEHCT